MHGVLQGVGVAVGVDVVLEAVDEELIVVVEIDTDELDDVVLEAVDEELIVVVEIDTDELDDGANWRRNAASKYVDGSMSDTM